MFLCTIVKSACYMIGNEAWKWPHQKYEKMSRIEPLQSSPTILGSLMEQETTLLGTDRQVFLEINKPYTKKNR